MLAATFTSKATGLQLKEQAIPVPGRGQVLIRLEYAALNHLDLWIWSEQILPAPVISGSDGSGIVTAVGEGVNLVWVGKEVVINPALYWGDDESVYSDRFEILGNPTNGTLAEYIVIPVDYVHEKPAHLALKESAALPLAALTAYRALFTKAKLKASEKILVTGIGGGAALYLLQMAVAAGALVYVTSSADSKIEKAVALGANGGFNYTKNNWVRDAINECGGFDVIIDSAGGDGFAQLTELAKPGARIILFGRTAGNINNLKPGIIYNKQLQITGTVMGTPREFTAMLEFYGRHRLHPVIDSEFSLASVQDAISRMESGTHFGKIVIAIN
jgi:NADPH:quinone reductase-like Zn-dependent oxidoreductase